MFENNIVDKLISIVKDLNDDNINAFEGVIKATNAIQPKLTSEEKLNSDIIGILNITLRNLVFLREKDVVSADKALVKQFIDDTKHIINVVTGLAFKKLSEVNRLSETKDDLDSKSKEELIEIIRKFKGNHKDEFDF